ncbi:hypothetical protein [Flagellimonas pelagia]|uniref:Uncharacterized protein n=1 Tax=Flagellimonas pelagia TaxID=2306998 RepID=A0A3A1NKY3_9FLAO|nr:hypothetical protein [Allomuricauda maritima]RIV44906.1 hypothetical protein D2V05_08395 [Allomuricauda maritima]TXJ95537.1 hypothetical protein FQ017_08320 [Allomuricauda maritima]
MGGKLQKTADTYYVIYSVKFLLSLLLVYSLIETYNKVMPFQLSDDFIKYVFCSNMEAKVLFQDSMETLMKSENSDFMVFKVIEGKVKNLSGYDEWSEVIEIDETTFKKLHLNLCQKVGRIVRSGFKDRH